MKQHILPKQAEEITEEQFYSLFEEVVKRKDWANYHHKKVTIGKMVEFLKDKGWFLEINQSAEDWFRVSNKLTVQAIYQEELCDALWEAVKECL